MTSADTDDHDAAVEDVVDVQRVVQVQHLQAAQCEDTEAQRRERGDRRADGRDLLEPSERGLQGRMRRGRVLDDLAEHVVLLELAANWFAKCEGDDGDDRAGNPEQDERQIVQTLARAGIYAATSRYEPFGLAPVEAALSRCALVASDIPSFRELWDGAAIFFRNNDQESLCAALERLQSSLELRRDHGNMAYRHARQHFSAERMVAGYKNLYRSLASAQALSA